VRRTSRWWVTGTLGITLAAASTACTGGDDPPATRSTSSSGSSGSPRASATSPTTTTPSSTTRTVAVPPEATKHTEAGAKAFAKFYVAQADDALVTADSSKVKAVANESCKGCKVFIDWADELKRQGRHHANTSFTVSGQLVRPDSTDNRYVIDILIDEAGVDVVDQGGTRVASEPAQTATLRTTLSWSASTWSVTESLLVKN
jgi:hypothetical protein